LVDRQGRLVGRLIGAADRSGRAARDMIRPFVAMSAQ
jgi:hypothetical protein